MNSELPKQITPQKNDRSSLLRCVEDSVAVVFFFAVLDGQGPAPAVLLATGRSGAQPRFSLRAVLKTQLRLRLRMTSLRMEVVKSISRLGMSTEAF